MAGGEGRRLRPFTKDRPKPLVEVGGKPILEHILLKAKAEGFSRFVFAVRHLGGMIEDYFENGKRWGVNITYLREKKPLGTAGAIRLLAKPPKEAILVTNGDVLADFQYGDLVDFHVRQGAEATMAVRAHEWQNPYGVVETQGLEIIAFREKPLVRTQINAGVYVLSPEACRSIPKGDRCNMPELFSKLQMRKARVLAYPLHEPWMDIGNPEDLHRAALGSWEKRRDQFEKNRRK
jgi:NDP-sugar pyrophosphorylase family protein